MPDSCEVMEVMEVKREDTEKALVKKLKIARRRDLAMGAVNPTVAGVVGPDPHPKPKDLQHEFAGLLSVVPGKGAFL